MTVGDRLEIVGLTDVGRMREHNEDKIGWEKELGLILLADGMGGHNAGEVASDLTVTRIKEEIKNAIADSDSSGQSEINDAQAVVLSMNAINSANQYVYQTANDQPLCAGMGTTLVLTLFGKDSVTIAHIGDSRIYRLRQDNLEQLTTDHSLVEEMVRRGYFSKQEALHAVNKNMITRALGVAPEVDIEIQQKEIQSGDIYLLCSDGLTDIVSDSDIHATLRDSSNDFDQCAKRLIEMANNNGGHDNISVVLVRIKEADK